MKIFAARHIYLRKNLPTVIEDAEQNLSTHLRWLLDRLWQEWKQTETEIEAITDEIERISKDDARCWRLRQIPGFGPLVSTATVAAIGNGSAFRRGRDSQPGLGWCRGSTPPGASRNSTASASAATFICVAC